MIRKLLGMLALSGLAALVAVQWRDLQRYVKIKRLSAGGGHPELVPAAGRSTYPQQPGDGTADGEGEFDAPRRGGPARAS